MGKGRAPCCDKNQVKRGPWSPAEDLRLITFIQKHGHQNWRALPRQAGLLRCGKSCRLRWINYLRPDVKRGNFTKEEEDTILNLHHSFGNKWSKIASYLPGRTDNEIKNVWNTHLKKRIATKNAIDCNDEQSKESSTTSSTSSSSSTVKTSGENGMEMDLGKEWNEGSVTRMPRVLENIQHSGTEVSNGDHQFRPQEESKEHFSSSSASSNSSHVTSQVDVSKPREHQINGSLTDDIGPNYDVQINAVEEVNKPDNILENAMEIPLESDLEFWNMFDDDQGQFQEASQSSTNNIGDAYCNIGEDENRRWLRYLENELGLETTRDVIINQENIISLEDVSEEADPLIINSENFEYEIDHQLKAEGDHTRLGYHHLWPSLF